MSKPSLSKEAFTCLLCTELLDDPVTVACGHSFCKACLALRLTKSATCPLDHTTLPTELPAVSVHLRDLIGHMFAAELQAKRDARDAVRHMEEQLALLHKALLTDGSTYAEHLSLQTDATAAYKYMLHTCLERRIELSQGAKARVLAAAFARRDRELVEACLAAPEGGLLVPGNKADIFGFAELLKAVKLLDAPRSIRAKKKKLAKLEEAKSKRGKVIGQLRSDINDLLREEVAEGSLSGSLAKYLRELVARIPAQKLEFFALQLPSDPWKELADVLHLHPREGLALPWFLPRAFGEPFSTEGTIFEVEALNADNALELLNRWKPPYSYVRVKLPPAQLSSKVKLAIASYSSLDTVLWWHHELGCHEVNALLSKRIDSEVTEMPYGKLMELLAQFDDKSSKLAPKLMAVADRRLRDISLALESPVVVIGDASGSMSVAVRTATFIAGVLKVLTKAELRFFNTKTWAYDAALTDVAGILKAVKKTHATGGTSPAASLWEFYNEKKVVRTFVIVTDEEENTPCHGMRFAEMFKKYQQEVYADARVVFVSFLRPNARGQMVTELERVGVKPLQFRLSGGRPDLSKLDALLGTLTVESADFDCKLRSLLKLDADAKAQAAELVRKAAAAAAASASAAPASTDALVAKRALMTAAEQAAASPEVVAQLVEQPQPAATAAPAAAASVADTSEFSEIQSMTGTEDSFVVLR